MSRFRFNWNSSFKKKAANCRLRACLCVHIGTNGGFIVIIQFCFGCASYFPASVAVCPACGSPLVGAVGVGEDD